MAEEETWHTLADVEWTLTLVGTHRELVAQKGIDTPRKKIDFWQEPDGLAEGYDGGHFRQVLLTGDR